MCRNESLKNEMKRLSENLKDSISGLDKLVSKGTIKGIKSFNDMCDKVKEKRKSNE